jgi:hypothetical protein
MAEERITRRDAIKKAAYTAPLILTMLVEPSFAAAGSGNDRDRKHGEEKSSKPGKVKWKD